MNTPDEALRLWAAEQISRTPEEISTVEFGYNITCWSEVTHEYDVYATIALTDGSKVTTSTTWSDALDGIAEYREAEQAMYDEHCGYHTYDEDY